MKKTQICLNEAEWRLLILSLNELRTKLISEGCYTDTVDETLYKVMNARSKRVKIAG